VPGAPRGRVLHARIRLPVDQRLLLIHPVQERGVDTDRVVRAAHLVVQIVVEVAVHVRVLHPVGEAHRYRLRMLYRVSEVLERQVRARQANVREIHQVRCPGGVSNRDRPLEVRDGPLVHVIRIEQRAIQIIGGACDDRLAEVLRDEDEPVPGEG